MNKAAKYDEQSASGVQIVAAANEEEAAVEQAAEEAPGDKAGRAAPEHEEGMTAEQTATEEDTVRRGSSTVSAGIGDAVAQSDSEEGSSRVLTYTEGKPVENTIQGVVWAAVGK